MPGVTYSSDDILIPEGAALPSSIRGELDDRRDPKQRAVERGAVDRELRSWADARADTELRRSQLCLLQRRRAGRRDLAQFDVVLDGANTETLVVRGELLIRSDDVATDAVRRVLDRTGLRPRPVECLDGRVLRLVGGLPAGRTAEVGRRLRDQGIPASVSHVTCPRRRHGAARP